VHAARHVFWASERDERVEHTAAAIRRLGPTMVFTRTRHGADRLAKQLAREGVTAAAIHGGRTQPQRTKALQSFANGGVQSLIATDVAARGVHVDGVAGVVHYDPPADASTYVHRSGRTARAGSTGTVVSLVDRANAKPVMRMLAPLGVQANVARVDVKDLTPPVATRSEPVPAGVPSPPVADVAANAERRHGVITFANATRGFAFIDGGDGKDLFAHHTKFAEWPIEVGQPVGFATAPGRKGVEAIDISALEPTG
jgi:cold shock CspA family protein